MKMEDDKELKNEEIAKDFEDVLEKITEEDYEQCANTAKEFLNKYKDINEAKPLLSYTSYFNLFSEAYRTWQVSYDYAPIREKFESASKTLKADIESIQEKSDEKKVLLLCFENLSKMLCEYTRCENSFINNDPYALKEHAGKALEFENKVLETNLRSKLNDLIKKKAEKENYSVIEKCQFNIAEWLLEYFEKNRLLHTGLKGCAENYINILKNKRTLTDEEINSQDNTLKKLSEKSDELSSELNAHIRFIKKQNERLKSEEKNTFLRINKGFLVNQISAGFNTDLAHKLFTETKIREDFEKKINKGFEGLGVEVTGGQIKQLHDVFQTSFGEENLRVLSYDLWKKHSNNGEIEINILNESFNFDLRFSISALGVCTIYFSYKIEYDENESEKKKGLTVEKTRTLQSLLCPHAGQVTITDKLLAGENLEEIRLNEIAQEYFNVIEKVLADTFCDNTFLNKRSILTLATDTGWFTYLYCYSIDEVYMVDNEVKNSLVGFDDVANHPDMVGFVIEQREARASFDDWRFMKPLNLQEKNLAHIRSHLTDGFFCSEYQAFIYFPDDPMFLTDQYEETVKLMVRMAIVLRFMSVNAQKLAEKFHNLLHEKKQSIKSEDLMEIRQLRLHTKDIQTLVSRAAISRYKDHGDLLKRVMDEMKLGQMVDLLDQQLKYLDQLYTDALQKIDGERESKVSFAIDSLIFIVSLSVLHDLVETIFNIPAFKHFFLSSLSEEIEEAKGLLNIILIVIFFIPLLFVILYKWREDLFMWMKKKEE